MNTLLNILTTTAVFLVTHPAVSAAGIGVEAAVAAITIRIRVTRRPR